MIIKYFCNVVLWTEVDSASQGLKTSICLSFCSGPTSPVPCVLPVHDLQTHIHSQKVAGKLFIFEKYLFIFASCQYTEVQSIL